jgi:hypothetical protein
MRRVLSAWSIVFLVSAGVTLMIPSTPPDIVDAEITRAAEDVRSLNTAVQLFHRRQGDYAPLGAGFSALVGTELVTVPIDPWGNSYAYRTGENTAAPLIYSIGVDGRDDVGAGDDVIGGEKRYRCEDYGGCAGAKEFVAIGALALAVVSLLVGVARGVLSLRS